MMLLEPLIRKLKYFNTKMRHLALKKMLASINQRDYLKKKMKMLAFIINYNYKFKMPKLLTKIKIKNWKESIMS